MTEHVVQLADGAHFTANSEENLLAAAQRAHWLVRYGCRNGNCQACAATLLAGSVLQSDTTITATDNPSILLCLCRAQSDLRIELPGDPLHGSSKQARRHYALIKIARVKTAGVSSSACSEGEEVELHLVLPAGRTPPIYPGQYFLLEREGIPLRADIDTTLSAGRDLHLRCTAAHDFAADRYIAATGPLGYCYTTPAATSILILHDATRSIQAQLLYSATPDAQLSHVADFDFNIDQADASFDIVLACTHDPQEAEAWYDALLERGVAFDEFRSDTAIRYRWQVLRQDDNANRFPVATALNEPAARRMVDEYQRRGHKQLYWAEPMTLRKRG